MEEVNSKKLKEKEGLLALSPLLVFVVLYLVTSIIVQDSLRALLYRISTKSRSPWHSCYREYMLSAHLEVGLLMSA